MKDVNYVTIKEGDTDLIVPPYQDGKGPKGVGNGVFFNPAMELNRDISVSFLRGWSAGGKRILDGMSASGARGVRIADETEAEEVVMLDLSKEAVELIKKNIENTDVEAKVKQESIESHMLNNRYKYDYVDIDPFGTPIPFYPLAARFVSRGGVVAVTATDTAVLCGTYKQKCVRRYSSVPKNNWCCHELGLRILIGYCVREAARYGRGAVPLLSYYDGHHFRTYLEINESAADADKALAQLNKYDFSRYSWEEGNEAGPLWAGSLFDANLISRLEPVGTLDEELIDTWISESSLPPFFYDTNVLSSFLVKSPPRLKKIIKALQRAGRPTSQTHFSPTGFKTEADSKTVVDVFKGL